MLFWTSCMLPGLYLGIKISCSNWITLVPGWKQTINCEMVAGSTNVVTFVAFLPYQKSAIYVNCNYTELQGKTLEWSVLPPFVCNIKVDDHSLNSGWKWKRRWIKNNWKLKAARAVFLVHSISIQHGLVFCVELVCKQGYCSQSGPVMTL